MYLFVLELLNKRHEQIIEYSEVPTSEQLIADLLAHIKQHVAAYVLPVDSVPQGNDGRARRKNAV